jgi:hypothetical protein
MKSLQWSISCQHTVRQGCAFDIHSLKKMSEYILYHFNISHMLTATLYVIFQLMHM